MKSESQERRALWLALAATLLWSTVATAFKLALEQVTPSQLVALASMVSTLILATLLLLRGQLGSALCGLFVSFRRTFLRALASPILYYAVLFEAYARLPAQVAQPLNYSWALLLSGLGAVFLGHRLQRREVTGLLLGYMGVVIVSLAGQEAMGALDPIGVALALISALLWATYWILTTKEKGDPVTSLFRSFVVALPFLFGWMLASDGLPSLEKPAVWFAVGYVGAFEMGFTFVLWQAALASTERLSRVSTISFLSPFFSLAFIYALLGESFHPLTLVGLLLIAAGVFMQKAQVRPIGRHVS